MCQERHPEDFDWIDEATVLAPGDGFRPLDAEGGACELVRPEIGDVLPVYVWDEYEGHTAKRFVDLSGSELDAYNRTNIDAMRRVLRDFQPDAIVTGHEVMGPYIAANSCGNSPYLAKLHGSALEYAVKEDPARFLPYAIEGLGRAKVVTGGSRYMLDEAASVIPGWVDHGVVVNPGADVELFRPVQRPPNPRPVVGFVGKLIANKGVHDLLVSLGLLGSPVDLVIVGFGDMDDRLRSLAAALSNADLDAARATLDASDAREAPAFHLLDGPDGAEIVAQASRSSIRFTGRLEHGPLSEVLPTFDLNVVPSILAEAFGMVAAEAAACGVIPIVPDHSGIGEVGRTLEEETGRPGGFTFSSAGRPGTLAERIETFISMDPAALRELGARVAEVARNRWSWHRCADDLLRLAAGG